MLRGALVAICLALLPAAALAAGKTHAVRIEGMKFVPERLEVAAGDTVIWTNRDLVPHTVTASGARVESGVLAPNRSFRFVAKKKGEMPYICRLHPVMKGVVVVK
ncbi:MAG TPA: cupredoxin family copper-binding protein [Burkholderiales bacterium]|nr:cupredoxin family copper-binding protein [Burkholderiales bacterium]